MLNGIKVTTSGFSFPKKKKTTIVIFFSFEWCTGHGWTLQQGSKWWFSEDDFQQAHKCLSVVSGQQVCECVWVCVSVSAVGKKSVAQRKESTCSCPGWFRVFHAQVLSQPATLYCKRTECMIHTISYRALNKRKALCGPILISPPARSKYFACLGIVTVAQAAFFDGPLFFLTPQQLSMQAPACSCTLSKQLASCPKTLMGINWNSLTRKHLSGLHLNDILQRVVVIPVHCVCFAWHFSTCVLLRGWQPVCTMALRCLHWPSVTEKCQGTLPLYSKPDQAVNGRYILYICHCLTQCFTVRLSSLSVTSHSSRAAVGHVLDPAFVQFSFHMKWAFMA